MFYLFGSRLTKKLFDDFFREPDDWDYVTNDINDNAKNNGYYYIQPTPDREMNGDEIITLRISHMIFKHKWQEAYNDVMFLKSKGCKLIPSFLDELRHFWNTDKLHTRRQRCSEEQLEIVKRLEIEC